MTHPAVDSEAANVPKKAAGGSIFTMLRRVCERAKWLIGGPFVDSESDYDVVEDDWYAGVGRFTTGDLVMRTAGAPDVDWFVRGKVYAVHWHCDTDLPLVEDEDGDMHTVHDSEWALTPALNPGDMVVHVRAPCVPPNPSFMPGQVRSVISMGGGVLGVVRSDFSIEPMKADEWAAVHQDA